MVKRLILTFGQFGLFYRFDNFFYLLIIVDIQVSHAESIDSVIPMIVQFTRKGTKRNMVA